MPGNFPPWRTAESTEDGPRGELSAESQQCPRQDLPSSSHILLLQCDSSAQWNSEHPPGESHGECNPEDESHSHSIVCQTEGS